MNRTESPRRHHELLVSSAPHAPTFRRGPPRRHPDRAVRLAGPRARRGPPRHRAGGGQNGVPRLRAHAPDARAEGGEHRPRPRDRDLVRRGRRGAMHHREARGSRRGLRGRRRRAVVLDVSRRRTPARDCKRRARGAGDERWRTGLDEAGRAATARPSRGPRSRCAVFGDAPDRGTDPRARGALHGCARDSPARGRHGCRSCPEKAPSLDAWSNSRVRHGLGGSRAGDPGRAGGAGRALGCAPGCAGP